MAARWPCEIWFGFDDKMISTLLSAIIAVAYVGIAFFVGGSEAALKCVIF
jgi:hypothetical protein